jgi:hypothetical protein
MDKVPQIGEQVIFVSPAMPPMVLIPAVVLSCNSTTGQADLQLLDGSGHVVTGVAYSRALTMGSWPAGT